MKRKADVAEETAAKKKKAEIQAKKEDLVRTNFTLFCINTKQLV